MPASVALPLVELAGVHVALGGRIVLTDITWAIRRGEHWLVSGSNGAGKTTLLRALRGDLPVVHGAGRRTYNLVGREDGVLTAKSRIGYLSPEFHERLLRMELPLTVREIITGGLHGTLYLAEQPSEQQRERVERIARDLELRQFFDDPMAELSFGQQRRTLLARALASDPRLLVLDEFAHGVDRRSREIILGALSLVAAAGTSLVIATHRREELPAAITHELRLHAGTVTYAGPLTEARPPRRRMPANGAAVSASEALVRLHNVDIYVEHRRVLHGLNWEIRPGERWRISGRNGAGKSTLAKLLYGRLRAAYGGTVERFGSPSGTRLTVAELRRSVALVSDDEQLRYDWNVPVETVVLSGFFASVGLMQKPSEEQLAAADHVIDEFDLQALRRRRFLELSFGQRRLVLVARALVRTPRLLILDEALNGFDADARTKIMHRVEELANAGTAIVMIGHHDSDVPEWIDKELVLDEGRIVSATSR